MKVSLDWSLRENKVKSGDIELCREEERWS